MTSSIKRLATLMLASASLFVPRLLAPAGGALLVAACNGEDCEPRTCAETGKGLANNGKSYTHCILCDSSSGTSSCTTRLEDASGDQFYECTDEAAGSCSKGIVDAEFAYCGIH